MATGFAGCLPAPASPGVGRYAVDASPTPPEASAGQQAGDNLPAWVGTPAAGSPPRAAGPLPDGLHNGDLVYSADGNLLWLLWENTKSRVWFPAGVTVESLQTRQQGPAITDQLRGATEALADSGQIVIDVDSESLQVYWIAASGEWKYPVDVISVDQATLDRIPTAYGEQYFAVYP